MSTTDAPPGAGATLTIDLGAVAANYRILRDRLGRVPCAAVVKADGYGLGAVPVARALAAAGADWFFTAHLGEAVALRAALPPSARIAVLNGIWDGLEETFLAHDLLPVLNDLGQITLWRGRAARLGRPLPAIVQIDTGMARLGLPPAEVGVLEREPDRLAGIATVLLLSHLACADEPGHPLNGRQRTRFDAARRLFPGVPASLAASSGIFLGPEYHFDLGRPGVALYGVNPTPDRPNPMRPVVRLEARILQVRSIDRGESVGYGAAHRASRPTKVATVPIGYADGFLRSSSSRGHFLLNGAAAPIIGRVSMDLITLDVTDCAEADVRPGAAVVAIGDGRTLDAVAAEAGTIGYEFLTGLGQRYARVYRDPA
ncbi:alanine racemase [Stella sp.]|uniref:alanine racemase n=1 Tax=Stella sp. TaxID=2912054 RepID=UPI0035AD9EFE